jgi:chromodomain-helicase-DNA-binding protein 4
MQGKTVQIAAFLGKIVKTWDAWPALIVVPNSTITNWVREIARWAPGLRVVSFYGGSKGRDIVKKYELRHGVGTAGIKFHVLVTTYETVTSAKDSWTVFKGVPRWEVLVVDEGQRRESKIVPLLQTPHNVITVKNDNSLLFKKLKELTVIHRIIMTGVHSVLPS